VIRNTLSIDAVRTHPTGVEGRVEIEPQWSEVSQHRNPVVRGLTEKPEDWL
jgi:hypothetical protein